MHPLTVSFNYI